LSGPRQKLKLKQSLRITGHLHLSKKQNDSI
jgi:hypothetical protein